MAPVANYDFLLKKVFYVSNMTRFLTKLGLNPTDLQQIGTTAIDKIKNAKL